MFGKDNNKKNLKDKILTGIGAVLCFFLIPVLIINCILICKSLCTTDEVPQIGGIFPLIVCTDSMSPDINGGDLIFCKQEKIDEIKVGDVISFFDPAGSNSSIVTHRVVEIIDKDGDISFKTKGDANNIADELLVTEDDLIGVYKTKIPNLGYVALFIQTPKGMVISILCPIILLIGYDMLRRRQYDKRKEAELKLLIAEIDELKAQKENEKLL